MDYKGGRKRDGRVTSRPSFSEVKNMIEGGEDGWEDG